MKKRERFFKQDSSSNSLTILRGKVSAYLLQNFQIGDAWFCDYYLPHREGSFDRVLDVVFCGSFLKKFLEGSLWPFDQYRLWVLSDATKKVMTEFFEIPQECVAVVPRYALFNRGEVDQTFNIKKIDKIYYVGQLRFEKNILISLWLIYFLQTHFNLSLEFNLVGDFFLGDDSRDQERIQFKERVHSLINELDWKIKPILHGPIENFSWKKESAGYALLNLSTYFHEDFSVAQAYAQENNWYSIVSEWGGFLDVEGPSAVKIPFQMIGNSSESVLESKIRAKSIAKFLVEGKFFSNGNTKDLSSTPPIPISDLDLQALRKRFVRKWGPSLYHVFTNMDLVRDSQKGVSFFETYQHKFSGEMSSTKRIVLINELDEKILSLDQRLMNLNSDHETAFVQIKDLRFKEVLQRVLGAMEIYIPKELGQSNLTKIFYDVMKDKIKTY